VRTTKAFSTTNRWSSVDTDPVGGATIGLVRDGDQILIDVHHGPPAPGDRGVARLCATDHGRGHRGDSRSGQVRPG
jgi:hypothetical protein